MLPKSTRLQTGLGPGIPPHPPASSEPPPLPTARGAYAPHGFTSVILSPVSLPKVPLDSAPAPASCAPTGVATTSSTPGSNPFTSMVEIPSPMALPSSQPAGALAPAPEASSLLPSKQPAALLSTFAPPKPSKYPLRCILPGMEQGTILTCLWTSFRLWLEMEFASIIFLTVWYRICMSQTLQPQDNVESITASDSSSDSEDADVSIPDVVSLPGSSASATGGERSRTTQLLEQRLPPTPALNQSDARCIPMSLEDRLRDAQELVEQGLEDIAILRADLNHFNDVLLQHILVLRNVRNNYLCL
ncbi:hypothetical protein V8E53_008098 [Lactarius tabidus]